MKEQNGIYEYSEGETNAELDANLRDVDFSQIHAPYGFTLVVIAGRSKWQAATEENYRSSESQRRGIRPDQVLHPKIGCSLINPTTCQSGGCTEGGFCTRYYNPSGHYYCACAT